MRCCTFALGLLFATLALTQANAQSETVSAAAQKAFDQGEMELTKGNHTGAMTLFKTAIRIMPDNPLYHHRLGKACLAAQKYNDMWIQFRLAVVLDPTHEEFASDFLRIWQIHDLQGSVNCGMPSSDVLAKLGEPDRRVENAQMKRWIYGFVAVDFGQDEIFRKIDLRGYTSEAAAEPEQVKVSMNAKRWQVANHMISRLSDNLELTPPGEVIQNWSELFSKQRFPLMSQSQATVQGMAESMHASLQKAGGLVQFEVLSETPTSILYHWRTSETERNPAQHEIAKLLKGHKDFYRVAYVKKTEKLTDAEFSQWAKVIGEATLLPRKANPSLDPEVAADDRSLNAERYAWELGKNLSFAALLRGRHGPEDVVRGTLLRVSRHAQALHVEVPAPAPLTDDASADTASAIGFLLDSAGKPIYNTLQSQHGEASAALFELAMKSTLLLLLYEPGDSTSESAAAAIQRSASKAKIETSILQPLLQKVADAESPEVVREAIQLFQEQVANALGGDKS